MKAIMFVKTKDGQYLFKGDSFWSKFSEPDHAKIYSDDDREQVDRWLKNGIFPWNVYTNKIEDVIERYNDAILGYFTPDENLYENPHVLKKGTTIEELGKPTYIWRMKMNPFEKWIIKKQDDESVTPDTDSMGYFEDYIQTHREEVLTEVLNKKDSD